jgi:ribosomal protein S18 acetylase RimI-like enzyme
LLVLGCFDESDLVGFLVGKELPDSDFYLEWMGILPSHRHQGRGSTLLKKALSWAAARSIDKAVLYVAEKNTPVREFYMAHGF